MRFIRINKDKIVYSIRTGENPLDGEIQSDIGELGQLMNDDGTFSDIEVENQIFVDMYQQLLLENQYQTYLLESILFGGN